MGNKRSRKQVRLSRALGIALTPKAQRYFDRRPTGPVNMDGLVAAANPTTLSV